MDSEEAALVRELVGALQKAKETIRAWHGMGAPIHPKEEEKMWGYYQNSPEMKQINAALEKAKGY